MDNIIYVLTSAFSLVPSYVVVRLFTSTYLMDCFVNFIVRIPSSRLKFFYVSLISLFAIFIILVLLFESFITLLNF